MPKPFKNFYPYFRLMLKPKESVRQIVRAPLPAQKGIRLEIKREDLLHRHISGNKYRKLFYNLREARRLGHKRLLTFGGAFSNHIAATAAAGKEAGFETVGIIRGDELGRRKEEVLRQNPTLAFATSQGMRLYFIDRKTYREQKDDPDFLRRLERLFGPFYHVPQGGTNELGVKGAEEILGPSDGDFDFIATAVGTGGTMAGLIRASSPHQHVLGFPALKENFLHRDIKRYVAKRNWTLIRDYHTGGFAKINKELIGFINSFYALTGIPLDPVYTGKMMFGLWDMIRKDSFRRGTSILVVHTGGLQGLDGMNARLRRKGLPLLELPSFYVSETNT